MKRNIRLLVINGPNINMLGMREPEIYGKQDYKALVEFIKKSAGDFGVDIECFQSNHEGDIIDRIQKSHSDGFDGIIINPAAYTHTSIAILDSIMAVSLPCIEVHLSDIKKREDFRQISFVSSACDTTFAGYGFEGYRMAIKRLYDVLSL